MKPSECHLRSHINQTFGRYQHCIDDWQAFVKALSQPLPVCAWSHNTRIDRSTLLSKLEQQGIHTTPHTWNDTGFDCQAHTTLGGSWMYLAGLLHIQEQVSMLPPHVLAPQEGDRILDFCAAPGNKTALLAQLMNDTGTIVANDRHPGRLVPLRRQLSRLGCTNICVTHFDGTRYPNAAGPFDGILVDAPCSGMGTSRKLERWNQSWNDPDYLHTLANIQWRLLRRAFHLCRPGGHIVYSTCTYSPEENEAVINRILDEFGPTQLELTPLGLPDIPHQTGLTSWAQTTFSETLSLAGRWYPHHLNSGGFFVAKLRKKPSSTSSTHRVSGSKTQSKHKPLQDISSFEQDLTSRFGMPDDAFSRYTWHPKGKRNIYLTKKECQPPSSPNPDNIGMLAAKRGQKYWQLTSTAAMLLGPFATKHTIPLDATQLKTYITGQTQNIDNETIRDNCDTPGLVFVTFQGHTMGMGILSEEHQLRSLYPMAWANEWVEWTQAT
jgi:NOL1/NOP2/sun family putative RNA methylase